MGILRNRLKNLLFVLLLPLGCVWGSNLDRLAGDEAIQHSVPETNDFLPEFHKFCDIHFDEGLKIASICEFINRKISFKAEGEHEDHWQQPKETLRLGTGDCEDVILLFAYLMRRSYIPSTYCWGECQNENKQVFAHAWIELESRDHKTYVMEFFSDDISWCVFPASSDKWVRKRHVMITHGAFCIMAETQFRQQKNVFDKLNEIFAKKHE